MDEPRELLKSPTTARNYEGHEYALSVLPPEKRDEVQLIAEDTFIALDSEKQLAPDKATWMRVYKDLCAQRDADLQRVLTPEEFERYDMQTTPAGTELARRVIGMNPTEEEMLEMYRLASQHWKDTGGVYGMWRVERVSAEQIQAADQVLAEGMARVLGPDRYQDYRLATAETGQQLHNFGRRYGLDRSVLLQVLDLQTAADELSLHVDPLNPVESQPPELQRLRQQLETVLGAYLYQAWQDGRRNRVTLDP